MGDLTGVEAVGGARERAEALTALVSTTRSYLCCRSGTLAVRQPEKCFLGG
jgi:hypothetical protein